MRALFVIFALAIGSASADPLLVYPRGTGSPGQTFAPVVLRAPLATSGTGCIASPTGSFGEPITCARASSANVTVGNVETTCGSNVCRVDAAGLVVEPARTNYIIQNKAYENAAWAKGTGGTSTLPVVTADQANDRYGNLTADKVDFGLSTGGATDRSIIYQGAIGGAVTTFTHSVWVKAVSGTPSTYVSVYDTGGATCLQTVLCTANTSTWTRCSATGTTTGSGGYGVLGNDRSVCPGQAGQAAGSFYVSQGQFEAGAYPTSEIDTAGTAVARVADDPTMPMLLSSGDTRWCIDATVTDENARGYAAGAAGIALGGTYPAANSFLLFFLGSGQISFEVYDAAAAQRQALSNAVPAFASGQHRVVACNEGAGALGLYLDGVKQTSTGAGAGTGIITSMPATLRLGEAGVGATVLAGGLKSLGVSRSSDPVVF